MQQYFRHTQVQRQSVVLAQTLQQSLKILAMTAQELHQHIQSELLTNPLLESGDETAKDDIMSLSEWLSGNDPGVKDGITDDEHYTPDIPAAHGETLKQFLTMQLPFGSLSKEDLQLIDYIIDLLDPDTGYLSYSMEEISRLTNSTEMQVQKCVSLLQGLEPAGIASANLEQCLLVQLKQMGCRNDEIHCMVQNHLIDIAKGNFRTISKKMGIPVSDVIHYVNLIKKCDPYPAKKFSSGNAAFIMPDVIVYDDNGDWNIVIDDKWTGSIGISRLYGHYRKYAADPQTREYLAKKLNAAKQLIQNIEQRRKTLLDVTKAIISKQEGYIKGRGRLQALKMSDVADELGIHVSTVSRAVKNKYIQLPYETIAIKDLFVQGIDSSGEDNTAVSADYIKQQINELVRTENRQKPLSDSEIVKKLEQKGILVSRRTVAKYRAELQIPNSTERRL